MRQVRGDLTVWLFLLALIPRLLYLASIPQEAVVESVDAKGYDRLARNLRAGHGLSLRDAPPYLPDGLRTPLYPLFIATVYTLAGERPVAVAVAQALLDSVTALFVGVIAGALLGRRTGVAAAALYALTPVQWRYAATLLAEIPLAFLISLSVWLLIRLGKTSEVWETSEVFHTRHAAACGAVAGLAALCKPNAGELALILAGAALWALRAERRRARRPELVKGLVRAGSILLAAAAVTAPWLARNWVLFARPFLSNAPLGYIARVSAPATLGVVEDHQVPPWSTQWEARYHAIVTQAASRYGWRPGAATPRNPKEADRRERQIAQVALEFVLAHPVAAARAHSVGFLRSWAPQEQAFWYAHLTGQPWETTGVAANTFRDAVEILCAGRPFEAIQFGFIQPWERLDPLARLLWYGWGLGHFLAGGLMVVGLWRLRHRPAIAVALAATILYATFPPGPIGYVRFRVPVVPLITVLEVAGVSALRQWVTG
jgi:4-amino-4-deoxy-L-arabinose transferase-like glycosyltransferase